jgi:hypothetical protein
MLPSYDTEGGKKKYFVIGDAKNYVKRPGMVM